MNPNTPAWLSDRVIPHTPSPRLSLGPPTTAQHADATEIVRNPISTLTRNGKPPRVLCSSCHRTRKCLSFRGHREQQLPHRRWSRSAAQSRALRSRRHLPPAVSWRLPHFQVPQGLARRRSTFSGLHINGLARCRSPTLQAACALTRDRSSRREAILFRRGRAIRDRADHRKDTS